MLASVRCPAHLLGECVTQQPPSPALPAQLCQAAGGRHTTAGGTASDLPHPVPSSHITLASLPHHSQDLPSFLPLLTLSSHSSAPHSFHLSLPHCLPGAVFPPHSLHFSPALPEDHSLPLLPFISLPTPSPLTFPLHLLTAPSSPMKLTLLLTEFHSISQLVEYMSAQ